MKSDASEAVLEVAAPDHYVPRNRLNLADPITEGRLNLDTEDNLPE